MRNVATPSSTTTSGGRQGDRRRLARRIGAGDELDAVFAAVARYFSLLSEPTRLRILHAICQSEQSVSAIVAATGATQTNVSRHLALLHQAGVVGRRRDGNTVYYGVADPEFVSICRSVCVQIAARIDAHEPLKRDLLGFAVQHD
ncbi:MAG: metalloregulator ArsR/SmtB family transcription factor [Casimicrobiaceae bacterium]